MGLKANLGELLIVRPIQFVALIVLIGPVLVILLSLFIDRFFYREYFCDSEGMRCITIFRDYSEPVKGYIVLPYKDTGVVPTKPKHNYIKIDREGETWCGRDADPSCMVSSDVAWADNKVLYLVDLSFHKVRNYIEDSRQFVVLNTANREDMVKYKHSGVRCSKSISFEAISYFPIVGEINPIVLC